jgi:flagellar hook protein FlgE
LAAWEQQKIRAGQDAIGQIYPGHIEGSNTDIPRNFVNLILSEFAYGANATVIRTMDEMTGSILNVKV